MDVATFDSLKNIQEYLKTKSRKDNGFGKTCHILLAITFCRLGFQVENYSSQGVDIDIWNHSEFPKFSIEVKTTSKNTVQLGEKDVEGLKKKATEGYEPAFAIMRIDLLSNWIFAKGKGIRSGNIPLGRLQTTHQAIPDLQEQVNGKFPQVVADYISKIQETPPEDVLNCLDKWLEKEKKTAVLKASET